MNPLSEAQAAMVAHAEVAPISAAYHAAVKVAAALMEKGKGVNPQLWPLAGGDVAKPKRGGKAIKAALQGERATSIIAAVGALAPFVRANPDAPAEALFRHAFAEGVHGVAADGFDALPLHLKLAFDTFRTTLLSVDKVLAEERAKLPVDHAPPKPVPIEDTIFEPQEETFAPVTYAKKLPAATPARAARQGVANGGKNGPAKKPAAKMQQPEQPARASRTAETKGKKK